jgi:hypothetical protein
VFYCTACGTQNPENRHTCSVCNTPRARDVRPQVYAEPARETVVGESAQVDRVYPNAPLYQAPQANVCPRCHRATHFLQHERISTGGILVFAILLLLCFPLCWIGLFIREKYLVCPLCGMELRAG